MAIVELQVVLEEKLNCGRCDGILIQVDDPALLEINDGAPVEELKTFIRGNVVEFEEVAIPGSCNIAYRYTISYDDVLLADPTEPLRACDIKRICCADCLFDYLDEIDFGFTLASPECGQLVLTAPDGSQDQIEVLTCTNLPIFGDGTAANPIDLLISTDVGNTVILGTDQGLYVASGGGETITTLVNNGDNTSTYTSENATVTVIDYAYTLTEPVANTVRLTRPDGAPHDVVISVNHTLTEPVSNTFRLTRPDGSFDQVTASETITTLVDVNNNVVRYTNEAGVQTFVDYGHTLTRPTGTTFRLTLPNGAQNNVSVTDTTLTGSVGFTSGGTPFTLDGVPNLFTSSTLGPLVINAPALRGFRSDIEIAFRPNFRFDPTFNTELTLAIDVSLNGGPFNVLSTHTLRYDLSAGNTIARSEYYHERLLQFIASGSALTVNARLRVIVTLEPGNTSQLLGLNGSITALSSTV